MDGLLAYLMLKKKVGSGGSGGLSSSQVVELIKSYTGSTGTTEDNGIINTDECLTKDDIEGIVGTVPEINPDGSLEYNTLTKSDVVDIVAEYTGGTGTGGEGIINDGENVTTEELNDILS